MRSRNPELVKFLEQVENEEGWLMSEGYDDILQGWCLLLW